MNQPTNNFNQGQMNFNRPPPNTNQGQMNVNQGQMNSNQGSSQASNGLGNRFSDMDLVNTVQSTTRPQTLEELYYAQRIKPVKNADGTTSWQIVDKSVVDALEKIQNKDPAKL